MTLAVPLTPDTESKLAAMAKSAGMDMPTYAARVLRAAAIRPPLDEILEPVRRKFSASGITEEQAAEQYEAEKHAARAAKRGRAVDE
jgi:ribosomal protein L12E/L44/L45/RPP1/RPP2